MNQLSIIQQDTYIEAHPPAFTSVKERLIQIRFLFELFLESRHSKVLIQLDQPAPSTDFHDIHTIVNEIHQEDWKVRNKGLFLKIAVLIPKDKINQYAFHQKAYQARDLNIKLFDSRAMAVNWLLGYTPLENVAAFFQPIVEISNDNIVGFEALARKTINDDIILPDQWLSELFAEEEGSQRLAAHMLSLALENLNRLDQHQYLSINLEPNDLKPEIFSDILNHYPKSYYYSRLVFDIAESGNRQADVNNMLDYIHSFKGRISLDNVGAGAAKLLSLIDIQPNIIKLDKTITQRLHEERVMNFIKQFCEWGKKNNIAFLAEGIESEEELNNCIKAGLAYGQGYLLGKPEPFERN